MIRGSHHSVEARQKMRQVKLGKQQTEETKLKIKTTLRGRKFSDEWKEKINRALKGRSMTEEWRRKMSLKKIEAGLSLSKGTFSRFTAFLSDDRCWPWRYRGRYPVKEYYGPTRRIYKLLVGPIPSGKCVCHHCDNPACCRPSHWFLGTNQENVQDSAKKGRHFAPNKRVEG